MNFLGYGYDIGIYENDGENFSTPADVFFPCAAACLIRRSAYEEVGGFDKSFFMYHEDVDLGWRFWLHGYRVRVVPESVVHHAFGGTSLVTGSMAFRNTLGLRHALRSLIKNYELSTLTRVLPIFLAKGVRTAIKERSSWFFRCLAWNLLRLPDTLRERRRVQKRRKVTDRQLSGLIWQEVRLPVAFPDYPVMSLRVFSEAGDRGASADMGDAAPGHLGYGWHGTEVYFGDGSTKYRWTKNKAVLYLWNGLGKGTLQLEVLALGALLKRSRRLSVAVNNDEPRDFAFDSDAWETIQMPYEGTPGPMEIRLSAGDTWMPHELLHNGDRRMLGFGVRHAEFFTEDSSAPPIEGISVIIPTYNRADMLMKTLAALEKQTLPLSSFEVIVVDDGSTDDTGPRVGSFISGTPLALRYFRQQNKKQGAARNLGIRHANRPLLLFIGDDIVPSPDFLHEHVDYHKRNNREGNLVVIGRTMWPKEMKVTPFMDFINEYGYQFGYSLIHGEGPLPFNFFYTSNISVLKSFLGRLDHVFDEEFATYGWEDIELGYRLEKAGMKLCYNAKAVAYHHHATDIRSFRLRQRNVGIASRTFLKMHPELSWFLGNDSHLRRFASLGIAASVLAPVADILDRRFSLPLPRLVYDIVLKTSYATGALGTDR